MAVLRTGEVLNVRGEVSSPHVNGIIGFPSRGKLLLLCSYPRQFFVNLLLTFWEANSQGCRNFIKVHRIFLCPGL